MSVEKDNKTGLGHGNGNMSSWNLPQPGSYKPNTAPAKPQGSQAGSGKANKTAYTPSVNGSQVSSIKSRY